MTASPAPGPAWLPKPTLAGDKVTLRPFVRDDAVTMAALLADPELLKLTGSVDSTRAALAHPAEPDQTLLDWYGTRSTQDGRLDLAILDDKSGRLVGEAVLNEWDPDAASCNFRILIGAAGRDRGLGTEATRLIVGYGFEQLGLATVTLGVFAFNPRAQRTYAHVGFRVREVRPGAFRFDGVDVDEIMMEITAPEWERHRGRPTLDR